ncbi:hypothetical protein GBF38_004236 [Nibea albiflora]|uniref:Uncharacterized protein n=1 Tax=Nibea albiflora TaxID=240163 RepID=A0ACB7FCI3_NIBAL|nr:hypothetical protein GBF38_004236 [Nibea albiflora]
MNKQSKLRFSPVQTANRVMRTWLDMASKQAGSRGDPENTGLAKDQMGTEEEIEWVRGREGREEVGENGSGRQKDEGGHERRKESGKDEGMREGEQKRQWEEKSRGGMIALMCLHE